MPTSEPNPFQLPEAEWPTRLNSVYHGLASMTYDSKTDEHVITQHAELTMTPRQRLLEDAITITTSDRNKSYGNPEDNFRNIADLWNAYLEAKSRADWPSVINPQDVSMMMILMKIARLSINPTHRDSILDVAGYAACAADIAESINKGETDETLSTL